MNIRALITNKQSPSLNLLRFPHQTNTYSIFALHDDNNTVYQREGKAFIKNIKRKEESKRHLPALVDTSFRYCRSEANSVVWGNRKIRNSWQVVVTNHTILLDLELVSFGGASVSFTNDVAVSESDDSSDCCQSPFQLRLSLCS